MQKIILLPLLCYSLIANAYGPKSEEIWYPQQALTADYAFSVQTAIDDGRHMVQAIRVINRKTEAVIQEIGAINGMPIVGLPNELVSIVDANFDGFPDLVIPFADGGAGPNSTDYVYLFNPRLHRFELNRQLSDLTQISFNSNRTISSASRGGAGHHSAATYRFYGKNLVLISDWDESYTNDGWIETTTRKLVKGRWESKTHRIPQPRNDQ